MAAAASSRPRAVEPRVARRFWRELAIVGCVFFAQVVVLVTVPVAAARDSLSPATTGWLLAAYGGTSLVADLPIAALSDAVGRRRVLLSGAAVLTLGAAVLAVVGGALGYLLGLVTVGFSLALLVSPSLAHLTEIADTRDQPSMQGANGSAQAGASIFASILAGLMLALSGPAASFALAATAGIAILLLGRGISDGASSKIKPINPRYVFGSYKASASLLRSPLILLATALAVGYGLIFLVVGNGLMPTFAMGLGVSSATVGVLLAIRTVVVLIVSPTFGRVVRRFGISRPVVFTTAVGAVGVSLVACAEASPLVLIPAALLQGVAIAYSAAAANMWVSGGTTNHARALGIATGNLGSRATLLITPPIFGAVALRLYPAAPFLVAGVMTALVAVLIHRLAGIVAPVAPDRRMA